MSLASKGTFGQERLFLNRPERIPAVIPAGCLVDAARSDDQLDGTFAYPSGVRLSPRTVRLAVSAAVLTGATAVALPFMTGSAAADEAKLLPVSSAADLVVDGAHQRVFISDPDGARIVTTDYAGHVLTTTTGLPGVRDLLLTDRLYAAVPGTGSIVSFDPATTTRVASYPTGGAPRTLAAAAGRIWFGEDGLTLGSLDLSGDRPVVTRGSTAGSSYEGTWWSNAPLLASSPDRPGLIAAVDPSISGAVFSLLDVSTDPPTPLARRAVGDRGAGMAFSPDGSRLIVTGVQNEVTALSSSDLSTIERYQATDPFPGAVAMRSDGAFAVGAGGDDKDAVALYSPGTAAAVKQLDLREAPEAGSLTLTSLSHAMAWEPGGQRLFAVAVKGSTSASHPDSVLTLQVLNDPARTPVTIQLTVPAAAQPGQAYTVSGFLSTPVPTGLPLVIMRTDPATPGGRRVGPQTVPAYNSFEFQDVQAVAGTVTYTVSIPGDDEFAAGSASASVPVAASRPTTLTLDRNGSLWAYGTTVTFTARLGATHRNRVVEIWADPAGNDQPNRLLRTASVARDGTLTAALKLTRNTTVSAVYRGDELTSAMTVRSAVAARASVALKVSRQYRTAKIGSTSYLYFRRTTHPLFTTTINPYPGRSQYRQIDVWSGGRWILWGPGYYPLNAAGVSAKELAGAHSTGVRYRVRAGYVYGRSGDTANATTYGAYQYFTFTK